MASTINFIEFDQHRFGKDTDGSHKLFDMMQANRIRYQDAKSRDLNYLPLHIRTPYDLDESMKMIPNDLYLLMQQGVVKPLIMMLTEAWDLFDTYAFTDEIKQRRHLTPDFGDVPFSVVIRHFTKRSIAEENITWVVPNKHHEQQIKFLQDKGYKVACKFLQFDYNLETLKLITDANDPKQKTFEKHYACLLAGTPRNHRFGIVYDLWKNNLLDKGMVSCCQYEDLYEETGGVWVDDGMNTDQFMEKLGDWKADKHNFKNIVPMRFDDKHNEHWKEEAYDERSIFQNSFLWVASETKKTAEGIFITEKTWKAIAHGNPFCINGDTGSLRYLKDMGFKTFDKFWDESYDDANDFDRIKIITRIIKNICDKTLSELQDLNEQMLPVLEHNQKHLKTFPQYDKLLGGLADA
jgi:hypothetical protein|tara:strand:+ start:128 stop:1351 length:1224 start_codon:yes stop_codon:yes gene_type:complete